MINNCVRNGAAVLAALALWATGCSTDTGHPVAEPAGTVVAQPHSGCDPRVSRPAEVRIKEQERTVAPAGNPEPADGIYGDPEAATRYWAEQSEGDCGLMATRMVIGEITGDPPTEREIIDLAAGTPSECSPGEPVYDESIDPTDGGVGHGTCTTDLLLLLDQFGIDADYTNDDVAADGGPDTGMDALLDYLNDDRQAIVCVNSKIIWDTEGDRTGCGHLITVAAVDVPNDIVYLGDSGGEDTRGEQVSLDVFEQAWRTGDHELLVTR
ncbi:C39 family peptidase [Mycobacterium sp. NPDC003323]